TVLMLVGICLLFEAVLGAFSPWLGGFGFLLLCRVVGGIGFGAATTVAPGYVAEIAPSHIRGRLIAFRQLAIILVLFLAGASNVVVMAVAGSAVAARALGLEAWQWMVLCLLLPALFALVYTSRLPASPRWLVPQGRVDEAAAVLRRVTEDEPPEGRVQVIRR